MCIELSIFESCSATDVPAGTTNPSDSVKVRYPYARGNVTVKTCDCVRLFTTRGVVLEGAVRLMVSEPAASLPLTQNVTELRRVSREAVPVNTNAAPLAVAAA